MDSVGSWQSSGYSLMIVESGARHFYASEGALAEADTLSQDVATPTGKCLAPCKPGIGTP
jgi:hypothetical protein